MFQHVLVPIDGSPTSESAVDKAIAIARAFGGSVTLVFVVDPYPFAGVGADFAYGQTQYLSAARTQANSALQTARSTIEAAGVPVTASLAESHSVWRGILEACDSGAVDLIVMGSHGRSGIEKVMLGSVAQRVVSHAKVPVLVVRG